jgi:hypothetical protein
MSAMMWKIADEPQMRKFITEQDNRFQQAMRAAHGVVRPTLVPPAPVALPQPAVAPTPSYAPQPQEEPALMPVTHWKRIVNEVCTKHKVSRGELMGPQREQRIVIARHEAMYRMKKETTLSLPAIGKKMGGKDHATVMNAVRRHEERMELAAQ